VIMNLSTEGINSVVRGRSIQWEEWQETTEGLMLDGREMIGKTEGEGTGMEEVGAQVP